MYNSKCRKSLSTHKLLFIIEFNSLVTVTMVILCLYSYMVYLCFIIEEYRGQRLDTIYYDNNSIKYST